MLDYFEKKKVGKYILPYSTLTPIDSIFDKAIFITKELIFTDTHMEHTSRYLTPEIKLSCYEDKFFKTEVTFDHHMLIWFISGETKIVQAEAEYVFKAGDIFLIPRNGLATIIN